jgi:hypothetical protein
MTLFVLLFLFSVLCSSGWWNTIKSALYIYFSPFILLGRFFVLLFLALKGISAWFSRDQPADDGPTLTELIVLPNPAVPVRTTSRFHCSCDSRDACGEEEPHQSLHGHAPI